MMKVHKQKALMYFEKQLKKCIKGSLLYMLAKKKLPPMEQGNYVKIDKDKDGFVHVNEDGILQAEVKESIANYEKLLEGEGEEEEEEKGGSHFKRKRSALEEREEEDGDFSPEEAVELIALRTKRVAEIKDFTRQSISSWMYSNMRTRVFLKNISGPMGIDQVSSLCTEDSAQNIMVVWSRRVDPDLNKNPDLMERKILDSIKRTKQILFPI